MKLSKRLKKLIAFLFTWFIVAGSVVYLETDEDTQSGFNGRLQDFENALFDFLYITKFSHLSPSAEDTSQVRQVHTLEKRIVLVDIDEASMERLGNYNLWERDKHAKVVQQLAAGGAAAVTFDILFNKADWGESDAHSALKVLKGLETSVNWDSLAPQIQSGFNYDSQFVAAVSDAKRVITSATVGNRNEYFNKEQFWRPRSTADWFHKVSPLSGYTPQGPLIVDPRIQREILHNTFPEFANAGHRMGLVNVLPDQDGVHRSEPLFYRFPSEETTPGVKPKLYPVIALQTALMLMGKTPDDLHLHQYQHLNLGQAFGVFQDSLGKIRTTYPFLSWTAIKKLISSQDLILDLMNHPSQKRKIDLSTTLRIYPEDGEQVGTILNAQTLSPAMLKAIKEVPNFFEVARDIKTSGDSIIQANPQSPQDVPGAIQVSAFNDSLLIGYQTYEGINMVALYDFDGTNIYEDEWVYLDEFTTNTLEFFHHEIVNQAMDKNHYYSIPFDLTLGQGEIEPSIIVMQPSVVLDLIDEDIHDLESQLARGDTVRFGDEIKVPIWGAENRMMINFLGLSLTNDNQFFERVSYVDLIEEKIQVEAFQGKIFMLGSTAPALFDMVAAPGIPNYPGVDIHLNMLRNILTNKFLDKADQNDLLLIIIMFAFLASLFATYLSPIWSSILIGFISIAYFIFNFQEFHMGTYYGIVKPQLALLTGFGFTLIYKFIFEEREKRQAVEAFKNYISPELIDQMLENDEKPTLGGEEKFLTAYFTDIASFSTFSEKIGSPTKLVELLNEYLTQMTDILTEAGGTLDKYEGDAIIAFFGAPVSLPNNAYSSCLTAVKMQHKLAELRIKWASEGDKWPEIVHHMRMRIGINSGQIVTGNMGSRMRMNYTMMGDAVNLAARLESGAKQYGVFTMCSKETLDAAMKTYNEASEKVTETREPHQNEEFVYRAIDKVRVVGKSDPVEIYELLNFKSLASDQEMELIDKYSIALQNYRQCNWDQALDLFNQCLPLEPHHPDRQGGCQTTPSHVFIQRCNHFKTTPPVEPGQTWDGVYTATEK